MPKFVLLFAAALLSLLPACASLKDDVLITVHSQGNDMDIKKTIFTRDIGGRPVIFKVLPEFSDKSIIAFHPFDSPDGTFGVALKLDFKGSNHLDIVTRTHNGEILLSMVNGTVVDYVRIDKVVHDGIFTIWRGLPQELIAKMDKKFPRIDELNAAPEAESSGFIDMLPSTSKEKKEARQRAEGGVEDRAKKEASDAKRRARGEYEEIPELPKGSAVPLGQ